jgi:hypothetical protein
LSVEEARDINGRAGVDSGFQGILQNEVKLIVPGLERAVMDINCDID